jgi:tRNA G18 (ribose-2'-O)-methylase SpoU
VNDADDDSSVSVGVGPWVGPMPTASHYDEELLKNGDYRNVIDKYRYWKMEAIIEDLDSHRNEFHIAIENLEHDFNIGSIVRTANALLAKEIHIIGKKRWNRRGAMVTDRYQHIHHHEDFESFDSWRKTEGLALVGIDNIEGSVPIETYSIPKKAILLFGQEGPGLSAEARLGVDVCLAITQFGSTRSMNAGAAAAIAMHMWVMQHVFSKPPYTLD